VLLTDAAVVTLLFGALFYGTFLVPTGRVMFGVDLVELELGAELDKWGVWIDPGGELRILADGTITTGQGTPLDDEELRDFLWLLAEKRRDLEDPWRTSTAMVRLCVDRKAPFSAFRRVVVAGLEEPILLGRYVLPHFAVDRPGDWRWSEQLTLYLEPAIAEGAIPILSAYPDVPMQQILEALAGSRAAELRSIRFALGADAPKHGVRTVTVD